jgi:hypothetical protein
VTASWIVTYKFSQQQIIGINYHYAKLLDGSFDEDNIRLLLIHLREFLWNPSNKSAKGLVNAKLLRELGDSVAHTVRTEGEIRDRIVELVRRYARTSDARNSERSTFVLYDLEDIVAVFREVLTDTGVLYSDQRIGEAFRRQSEDIKLCLISMLHGQIFQVHYEGLSDDFYFLNAETKESIFIRTELDLGHAGTIRELRLNALIPCDGGGTWAQCVLRHELSDPAKIDTAAYDRTASVEGYCEPVKALRRDGRLVISPIRTGVPAIEVYKILRAVSYDTRSISKRITVTPAGE